MLFQQLSGMQDDAVWPWRLLYAQPILPRSRSRIGPRSLARSRDAWPASRLRPARRSRRAGRIFVYCNSFLLPHECRRPPRAVLCSLPEARNETSRRRGNMKLASTLSVALVAGLSFAMWTSDASAQSAGYSAAASKCRAQVRAQYPTARESEGMRSSRARAYQACMAGRGYRP